MKKVVCLVLTLALCAATVSALGAGTYKLFDFTYSFDYAQIAMPDGSVVRGEVESWRDYEDGDCVQVEIDGKIYLTHYANVVLIAE